MAAPWDRQPHGLLQLLSLGVLAALLQPGVSPRQAACWSWLFATSWLVATFWWMYVAMATYAGLPAALSAFAVFCLGAVLAIYYAAAGAAFVALRPRNSGGAAIVFAALWLCAELARGVWFTGFGWGGGGYAHIDGLARFARFVGAYGVAFLTSLIASLVALWLVSALNPGFARRTEGVQENLGSARRFLTRDKALIALQPHQVDITLAGLVAKIVNFSANAGRRQGAGMRMWQRARKQIWMPVTAAVLAAMMAWTPGTYSRSTGSLQVALLQGNIAQDVKFQPGTGVVDALRWYGEQLAAASSSLVVAPETAIPLLPQDLPTGYWSQLRDLYQRRQQAALIGVPLMGVDGGYTNSVVGFRPGAPGLGDTAPYRYDKHHLVPFGEFIPPLFRWFTDMMNIPLGDFNRGKVVQPAFNWQGQRFAPNICYEDLFGEELARRFADPEQAPTVFVNVSNIGWFGNTVAIDQHLNISRMRALEFERPFIRATNTGDTVIISHDARVTHSLPRHVRGVLQGEVQGRNGMTPYAWWVSRFGLWPLWGLVAAVLLGAALARGRRHRTGP